MMILSEPRELLSKTGLIKKETIIAFISTFIMGFLTHLYPMTHRYFNEDYHYAYIGDRLGQLKFGRWFFAFFYSYADGYIIPTFTMIIAILLYSVTVALLVRAFNVKRTFYIIAIAGFFITFPIWSAQFGYMFSVECVATATLFTVIGFCFANKSRLLAILGAVFLCCAMGTYQSTISIAAVLCVISLFIMILDKNTSTKDIINKTINFLIFGILGFLLYTIITKLLLNHYDMEMTSYYGIDEMWDFSKANIIVLLIDTYRNFFSYLVGKVYLNANLTMRIINMIFALANILIIVISAVKIGIHKNPFKLIFLLLMLLVSPLIFCMSYLISKGVASSFFAITFIFLYMCPFIFLSHLHNNKIEIANKNIMNINSWVITISTIIMIFNFYAITNIYYHAMEITSESTKSLINRMIYDIDKTEGFTYDVPIALSGLIRTSEYYNRYPYFDYEQIELMNRGIRDQYIGFEKTSKFVNLCNNYFGTRYKTASNSDIEEIKETPEYEEMKAYPKEGSMRIINGVLMIKIGYDYSVEVTNQGNNSYEFTIDSDNPDFDKSNYIYGWRVYKDGVEIHRQSYGDKDKLQYQITESGTYQVMLLINRVGSSNRSSYYSEKFTVG